MSQNRIRNCLSRTCGKGLIASDSYTVLRALLVISKYKTEKGRRKKRSNFNMEGAGRWSLIRNVENENKDKKLSKEMRAIARISLSRYGMEFRKLLERESFAPSWRDLVIALRLLELRGEGRKICRWSDDWRAVCFTRSGSLAQGYEKEK